ncbi:E3 ubiquitin/ISG15 ligase TRIM25-like [Mixophyes fleayi]|uniref:E3 ubiquitin/ISG15 ligase TRIM25-like n=1 Tax=Mixophyes fleayi TaxID=3061075 RepID=UPI003F4DD79C
MASADLKDKLIFSLCLSIYTDPVTPRCGHNFCRVCVGRLLDAQNGSGVYTCPECRAEIEDRPSLQRNITLCNVAEHFLSTQPEQEETGIFCTYCIHSPAPAVKSCLMCEASPCSDHLRVHSKSAENVISDPTTAMGGRKTSIHKKILEYYCLQDAACICVSCKLDGESQGPQVEILDEASRIKKEKLGNILEKLILKREEIEKRVLSLQEHRQEVQEKAIGLTERVTAMFSDISRQMEDLEKRVLSEISWQEQEASFTVSDLIQELEIKKDELSMKMRHIEELCNVSDPVTVLQEAYKGDLCDTKDGDNEDRERHDKQVHDVSDLDEGLIPNRLHIGLKRGINFQDSFGISAKINSDDKDIDGFSDDVKGVSQSEIDDEFEELPIKLKSNQRYLDILLDFKTAAHDIDVSHNLKTASWVVIYDHRPETPERFRDCPQVLSSTYFTSGQHYWEVETCDSGAWMVGMSYPSIDRRGRQSYIGNNNKSWCLCGGYSKYSMIHDGKESMLSVRFSCNRFRIYLDYEAGQLSFYELCDPIRHLHTYAATFTEPLHAALCVWCDSWVTIKS